MSCDNPSLDARDASAGVLVSVEDIMDETLEARRKVRIRQLLDHHFLVVECLISQQNESQKRDELFSDMSACGVECSGSRCRTENSIEL